jgi:glycopeptide antibiotics resistance protein
MLSSHFRFRRAADFTALRLGRAVLGYLSLMMAIITLAPFRFALAPAHGLTQIWSWSDAIMNVVMFVPFGFVYQLTRPRGAPADWPRVLVLGAALSGMIELLQLFEADRYTSLVDVVTNAAGAALGTWLFARLATRVADDDAVQTLALELPLMGLVYLLVPLCWLIGLGSAGDERRVLLLAIAIIAGAVMGTVHAAYIAPLGGHDRRWLVGTVSGWTLVSVLPGARSDVPLLAAALTLTLGVALLRSIATTRELACNRIRFERPTLRLVLPVFAAYLALSSLWPLTGAVPDWHGTLALTVPGVELEQPVVFRLLEHIAAFTMVGYISAEFYGRDEKTLGRSLPRLFAWTASVSLLLEVARGFHEAYGASALLFAFTQVAALFGAWLYVLQRAHVRALVDRKKLLAAMAAEQKRAA